MREVDLEVDKLKYQKPVFVYDNLTRNKCEVLNEIHQQKKH